MDNTEIELPQFVCKRCGHIWIPRATIPVVCPMCKRRDWNENKYPEDEEKSVIWKEIRKSGIDKELNLFWKMDLGVLREKLILYTNSLQKKNVWDTGYEETSDENDIH